MEQDKLFKKIAADHESHVDFDQLWNHLEPHVPVKKKRRLVVWFWLGAFILFSLAIIILGMNDNIDQKQDPYKFAEKQPKNELRIADNNSKMEIEPKIVENANERTSYGHQRSSFENISKPDNLTISDRNEVSQSFNSPKINELAKNVLVEGTSVENGKISDNNHFETPIDYNPIIVINDTKKSDSTYVIEAELETDMTGEIADVPPIAISINGKLHFQRQEEYKMKVMPSRSLPITLIPGFGWSNINYAGISDDTKQSSQFNQTEKGMEWIGIGLSTDLKSIGPWTLKTGIRYNRQTSHTYGTSKEITSTEKPGISEVNIDELGLISEVTGNNESKIIRSTVTNWYTYHHILDLPLLLKYELIRNGRHSIGIEGGIILPILLNSQGGYLDENLRLIKFTQNNSPFSKNLLGWNAGITWEYKLNRKNSLFTSLNYEVKRLKMIVSDIVLIKGISITQFNAGYKYHF